MWLAVLALALPECQSYRDPHGITHCYKRIGGSSLCISARESPAADEHHSLKGTPMSDPNAQIPDDPYRGQRPPQDPYRAPYQGPAPVPAAPLTEADDRQWASFAHLGGILSFFPSLLIWLIFKDRGRFTAEEAKEALNFQITLVFGYVAINIIASFLASITFGIGGIFGIFSVALWVVSLIFSILGFQQAKDGHHYRYPFAVRLIK